MKIETYDPLNKYVAWSCAFILLLGFIMFLLFNLEIIKETETQRAKSDSLENVNRALKDSLEIFKAPLTPASLKFKLEFAFRGLEYAEEFATGFTAVAIKESGSNLSTGACQKTNNLWGFHKRPRSEYVTHYYNNGRGETFSCYLKLEHAIMDLREWVLWKEPQKGERFVDFIKRRGYNPDPEYYKTIERLML